jgi:hypothetical protein
VHATTAICHVRAVCAVERAQPLHMSSVSTHQSRGREEAH